MRILVVHPGADCSVSDVHDGIVTGLRQHGHWVESVNLNDRLWFYAHAHVTDRAGDLRVAFTELDALRLLGREIKADIYDFWPDVVLVVSGFNIETGILPLIRSRGHHLILWATEAPYEDDKQLAIAPYFDTIIVNDPITIDNYRTIQPRTWYLPHSYNPQLHRPGRAHRAWRSEFLFIGTGFPSRVEFLEKADLDGIDVLLAGNWEIVDDSPIYRWVRNPYGRKWMLNRETARCYRSGTVGANFYRKENTSGSADGWAMGPREVEMAACGLPFLREPRGEGDELLPMLPTFTTPAEFGDQLRWLLDHEAARVDIARAARAAVHDRTFKATTGRLLDLLGDVRPSLAA